MIIEFAGTSPSIEENVFVAPNAAIVGNAHIGASTNVWFGAVIRGDYGPIRIGKGCSIQDNVVIHVNHTSQGKVFPTVVGDNCVIGHGSVVEGCSIGEGCLVGMNAVVLPGAEIGAGSIVAAGAVVKAGDIVPACSLVAGAPAIVKRTAEAPSEEIAWAAAEYRTLAARYLSQNHKTQSDNAV